MIHGLDTGFLVAAEVREHAEHAAARDTLAHLLSAGIQSLLTTNKSDFLIFAVFTCITPSASGTNP